MGRADGRGVLMGCHEPLAGVLGRCTRLAGSGLVRTGHAGGHFEMLQALPWMGWRAARLSRGCHQRRETRWDRGEMRCDELCTFGGSRDVGGTGGQGLTVTGCQRLWWRSWRWRCWGHDREKPSTPGNAGCSAADGVVRRRRQYLAVSGRRGKSAVSMWLTGRCGSTVGLWLASPAEGCRGGDDDSVLVAVVGWHRDGWWACCVGGAGRDLRHVGVRGGESVWGRAADVH